MITEEYRNKVREEYTDSMIMFAELFDEDAMNPTNFILFKLLTDISERLDGIETWMTTLATDGIDTHNV
jgi:hypothetical protein